MLGVCCVALLLAFVASCASTDPVLHGQWVRVEAAPLSGRTAVVQGDWDDVYAAALVSTPPIEGAIVRHEGDDRLATLTLITIDDEPGELIAERLSPPSSTRGGPEPIRITARIGLFGNPAREERLIRAIGDRLRELAARDWAPVR